MKRLPILITGLVLLLFAARPECKAQSSTPSVTNKTTSVQVVSLEPDERARTLGFFALVLKNMSTKNIDGYSLTYDKSSSLISDLTSSSIQIKPGDEFSIPVTTLTNLAIHYVLFEDDTFDGDANGAKHQLEIRRGRRAQLERIYLILNAIPQPAGVEDLKKKLRELPGTPSFSTASGIGVGEIQVRDEVMLRVLKFDRQNFQKELESLAADVSTQLTRLSRLDQ